MGKDKDTDISYESHPAAFLEDDTPKVVMTDYVHSTNHHATPCIKYC